MTTPARRRALLVGIGHYQNSRFTDLPGVAVDLKIMHEVLGDAGIGAFDVIEQVSDPDAATLRGRIADFLERSETDELAVVYVSGHGVRSAATGEFHFVASGTDPERLSETAVPADYLNEHLEGCRAGQKVVILDCCESGGFTAGFTTRRAKSAESVGAPLLTKGVYVLASSQALEASWAGETPESPSLFTGEIVGALRSGAGDRDRDGRTGVAELYEHVNAVLKARPTESRQTPVVSSLGVSGAIYLAKAPARRTDPLSGKRAGAGAKSADGFAAAQGSGPVNWKTLLGYYADCVRAENSEDKVLRFAPRQPGVVCVGGSEQFLSGTGAGADGLFPVPDEFAGHIDEAVKNGSDLVYGYPVLVLLRDADGRNRKIPECAPLLIRRLEIVQSDDGSVWLRPYGEAEPNPVLSKDRLGAEDAENLLRTYIPTWGADDHIGMSREINHLLRDVFELPWIDEIRPDRLATDLDTTGSQSGARNAAVLMALDSAGTVRQLLRDLEEIAGKETSIGQTALGCLLDGAARTGMETGADPVVIGPMNDGQGDVLNAAMSRRLTVATGPPGTGKSSLIVNLVATAIAAGQTVLVASTNNTAVDEVWHRCAAMIDGLIVRTGSKGNGDGTNYRAAERQTLQDVSAAADASGGRSLATAQAAYARAVRDYDAAQQAIAEKGSTEAALLAAGRQRAQALDDIRASRSDSGGQPSGSKRLVDASDSELIRLRARSDKLGRARWFATGRRQRFLGRLGIASTAHSAKTLCGVVGAYAESETAWRALSIRPHADDAVLTTDLAAADDKRRAEALVLLKAKLQSLRATRRTALQALADHTDNGSSDWGKLRAALPAVPGWAVTCLSARRFPPNPGMFDLVIIDEASQCSIPAVLPVLFRAKRAVIIGDPLQLPHVTTLKAGVEATIREGHAFGPQQLLDQHLAYRQDSAFHALEHAAAGSFTLAEHYRCHPDIARLADNLFYAPRGKPLTILTPSQLLRGVPDQPSVRWIDQPGAAMRHENGSWINQAEAERTNVGVRYFLDRLPPDAVIGVVTPFKAQAATIRSTWSGEKQRVRVGTAHSFQGGECDAVIYSLVAADGISSGALGFLDDQANLWNVAITRARAHLFVIGDRDFWIRRGGLGLKLMHQVESSRQNPDWPHDDELRDLLYTRLATPGNAVDLAETRAGYLADAVVTAADGTETAIVLDTGPSSGDHGRSLLLHIRRAALLESAEKSRLAQRLPAWRLYGGSD